MPVTPIKYVVEVDTSKGLISIDKFEDGVRTTTLSVKELNSELRGVGKNAGQVADKTGLAGAAIVEMGRTISDSNYGMTAMANNLQQLSTLMITLVATTKGGLVGAFNLLKQAMLGPLGIIIILQTVLTLFERVSMQGKKVSEKIKISKDNAIEFLNASRLITDEMAKQLGISKELNDLERTRLANLITEVDINTVLLELRKDGVAEELKLLKALDSAGLLDAAGQAKIPKLESMIIDLDAKIAEWRALLAGQIDGDGDGDRNKLDTVEGRTRGIKGMFGKGNPLLEFIIGTNNKEELARSAAEAWKGIADAFAAGSEDESVQQYWFAQMEARKAFYIGMIMPFYDQSVDLLLARYDREAVIEQNATNQKNNALRDRLRNENLSADERKRIQLKISRNDEALRVEQEKIAEKRFNAEKAANIVTAIVETYVAANKALAQFGGAPFGIGPMAATIALGLANVATIASQKFQTTASTAPTAGDLGVTQGNNTSSITPNFNIVGDTGINQLRDTILGVVDRPVKTYITGKDVRTSEELERNIIRGSTLGG